MSRLLPAAIAAASFGAALVAQAPPTRFEPVQPELFTLAGAQPNAWADYDGDGDPDLFVGFNAGKANRLYRNDPSGFLETAAQAGVADQADTRAAAWGDFDGDGDADLYVGFSRRAETRNKLYRNDGRGRFTDVAQALGVDAVGETRQVSWIDFDNDGDLDLFVAMRDAPNLMFRQADGRFTSVGKEVGLDDPRRTVGAVWWDADGDGDLDLFVANQNGDRNGFFRNDGGRFNDVATSLGMDAPGRPETWGSNGPSLADVDNDGDLDLFVAGYGRNYLYRADGRGRFTEAAEALGLAGGEKATPSRWGDIDNDGRPEVYVSSYVDTAVNEHDFLYRRGEDGPFVNILPSLGLPHGATHGVQFADIDGDGDLDLALANNNPNGAHPVYRNLLPPDRARRSIQVAVVDGQGRATRAGSEVRVYAANARLLLGMGIVDTGSGYCSQNSLPVHVGLPSLSPVDVEVTSMSARGQRVAIKKNVALRKGAVLVVKTER